MDNDIRLIVWFMDGKILIAKSGREIYRFYDSDGSICQAGSTSQLKYESSMDWLKPVIDKIGELENQADIEFAKELDEFKKSKPVTIFNVSIFAPINLLLECVIDFIKWYNK